MDSPNLDRALRFKSNAQRGGILENSFRRRVKIGRVSEAILTVDFVDEEGAKGPFPPTVRNVGLEQVTSTSSPRVLWIAGFPAAKVDDIRFTDCTFRGGESAETVSFAGGLFFRDATIEPAKKRRA